MKKFLILLVLPLFLVNCSQEDAFVTDPIEVELRGAKKVNVCHNGHIINVNINAVPAHQNHGDAVDMDGDGYFDLANVCMVGVDCDDNDASIHPSAAEICDNEIDDDCDALVDCDDDDCDGDSNCALCNDPADCCFCPAAAELVPHSWNGDVNNPIIWPYNRAYGMCSNCLLGNCGYSTPLLGFLNSGSPASVACRQHLVDMANDLNLIILYHEPTPAASKSSNSIFGL